MRGPAGDERYGYDPSGNLTHATWPTPGDDPDPGPRGPRTYTGTLITRAGNTTYTHDRAGRLTRRHQRLLSGKTRTWTYTWDAHNHLTDVRTPDGTRLALHLRPPRPPNSQATPHRPAHAAPDRTHRDRADPVHLGRPHPRRNPPHPHRTVTTFDYQPGTFTPLTQRTHTHPTDKDDNHPDQTWYDERFHAIITDLVGTPTELITPDGQITRQPATTLWGVPRHPRNHSRRGHALLPAPVPRPIP